MAYDKPNYTQTPNALFSEMSQMGEAELRVVLAVCRSTFGWHKEKDTISLSKLQDMTGMSRQGVVNGIGDAVDNGVMERERVKDTYRYWLVVNDVDQGVVNVVDQGVVNDVDPQKKVVKKKKTHEPDLVDGMLRFAKQSQELDQSWMPPHLKAYLANFQRQFYKDKDRTPSKKERGYWIKTAEEWSERGYKPRDVVRAYKKCKEEGTAIKSPASITWAFDNLGSSKEKTPKFGRM